MQSILEVLSDVQQANLEATDSVPSQAIHSIDHFSCLPSCLPPGRLKQRLNQPLQVRAGVRTSSRTPRSRCSPNDVARRLYHQDREAGPQSMRMPSGSEVAIAWRRLRTPTKLGVTRPSLRQSPSLCSNPRRRVESRSGKHILTIGISRRRLLP